jgi:hypothetical protein
VRKRGGSDARMLAKIVMTTMSGATAVTTRARSERA